MENLTQRISPYGDLGNQLPRPNDLKSRSAGKNGMGEVSVGNGEPFDHLLSKAVRTLREVEYWIQEWHGATLEEIKLQDRGDHALAIVKAVHKGKSVVAFTAGTTLAEALVNFCIDLSYDSVNWKPDRYPKKHRD